MFMAVWGWRWRGAGLGLVDAKAFVPNLVRMVPSDYSI